MKSAKSSLIKNFARLLIFIVFILIYI